jgi:hypothetical protein
MRSLNKPNRFIIFYSCKILFGLFKFPIVINRIVTYFKTNKNNIQQVPFFYNFKSFCSKKVRNICFKISLYVCYCKKNNYSCFI